MKDLAQILLSYTILVTNGFQSKYLNSQIVLNSLGSLKKPNYRIDFSSAVKMNAHDYLRFQSF